MVEQRKLTKDQREWLEHANVHPKISPGTIGASSCASLARRGLLADLYFGVYRITDAGRAALNQEDSNAGR